MTKKLETLKDLFIEQGRELYDASKQEEKQLPEILNKATHPQLKKMVDRELKSAKSQITQLEEAFKKLNVSPQGEKNECCQSIFKQTTDLIGRSKDAEIRDAVIINTIQRLNHNKITGYGSLSSYAREIGQSDLANSLRKTLIDERDIDEDLSELAEKEINRKAVGSPL